MQTKEITLKFSELNFYSLRKLLQFGHGRYALRTFCKSHNNKVFMMVIKFLRLNGWEDFYDKHLEHYGQYIFSFKKDSRIITVGWFPYFDKYDCCISIYFNQSTPKYYNLDYLKVILN